MSGLENLHDVDWVAAPNAPYIIKYLFNDTGYNILISNLVVVYGERLQERDVQRRFCELNPFAEMKSQVILENLKKSLEQCLNDNTNLSMEFQENRLNLKLLFPAAHVKCTYVINMDLLPPDQVMNYIICPTIFNALLSQQKVMELQKQISSSESIKSSSVRYVTAQWYGARIPQLGNWIQILTSTTNTTMSMQDISGISKGTLDPEFLKGQNVPTQTVLESFLKIQSCFKELCAENNKAYYSKREKPESISVSTVSPKKCKIEENNNSKSFNIKFEDNEESAFVKKEISDALAPSQEIKVPARRKKIIKF